MAKQQLSLARQLRRQTPPVTDRRRLTWLDKLPVDQRLELLELKQDYRAGRLAGWNARALWDELHARGYELGAAFVTFRAWLGDYHGRKETPPPE